MLPSIEDLDVLDLDGHPRPLSKSHILRVSRLSRFVRLVFHVAIREEINQIALTNPHCEGRSLRMRPVGRSK